MNEKEKYYAHVATKTIHEITKSMDSWTSFLSTMGRNYDFSYPEQVMIHAQRPNATLCKEFDAWKDEKLRYVKRGSKGIALFVTNTEKPYLRYVFDVADTGERRNSLELDELWKIEDRHRKPIQSAFEKTFGVQAKGTMEMQFEEVAEVLAKDYWDNNKSDFIDIVADSFLEEYDDFNIEVVFKKAVSISATYALYSRCVDVPEVYFEQDDFLNIFEFNTRKTINALGTAVNSVTKEMFKEIERTVFEVEKSIESERSKSYDDRDELFESGRIFDSGHSTTEQRSETSREVWEHEENIPQGTQTDDLRRYDSERDIVSAPLGSTGNSDEANRTVDERASGEESGTGQENTADVVGAAHEQPKSTGRRNRTDGSGVQLTLNLFLSQDEQIKFIDEAENEVKTSFAFSFEQNETDLFLLLGSNTDNARMIVATEFMKQKSVEEIIPTLKEVYHGGYGIQSDKRSISAWYSDEGISFVKGNTARDNAHAQFMPWEDVAKRIGELLEEGKFATNVELAEAPTHERKELSQKLWYLYHDLSDEIKSEDVFPSLADIKGNGFPSETQSLAEKLSDKDFCSNLEKEFQVFKMMYAVDRNVLRFHYHKIDKIEKALTELNLPRKEFDTEMFALPEVKSFITDDEINQDLIRGSSFSEGKKRIFNYFEQHQTTKDRADFLKGEYGTGGHSHALSGATASGQNHDAKGIIYDKAGCEKVKLNRTQVANRIDRLIDKGLYYTAPEPQKEEEIAPKIDSLESDVHTEQEEVVEAISDVETEEIIKDDDSEEVVEVEETEIADEFVPITEPTVFDVPIEDEKVTKSSPKYQAGQKVFLEGTEFEITEVREHEVQLLDPTLYYPIFRAESMANFERLLSEDSRNTKLQEEKEIPAVNFTITDEHLGEGGAKQKYANNVAAIRMLLTLEEENRNATSEEQEILSKYVGWGGLSEAFDVNKQNWSKEYLELKSLLPEREYEMARASTLNAHYTSPTVIRAMYDAVLQMGFKTGNILEPSMGVGNFFGLMPEEMRGSKLYGIELDSISGRIAKKLYPNADITVAGFETTDRRDFFDLSVGNVPFGNYKVSDKPYDKLGFSIHNYFFAKALDQVRPGGVVAFVTSRYTMDQQTPDVRKYLAQRAEFLGAIRLPNNAFKAIAGTDVVSDIIFLQKREHPIDIEPDWVHLGQTEDGFAINSYFVDNPQMVLGELTSHSTQYGKEECTVIPKESADLSKQLQEAIKNIKGEYVEAEIAEQNIVGELKTIPANPDVKNFSFAVVDDEVYFRENSIMRLCDHNETAKGRIKGMVELRQTVNELINYQLNDYPDESIKEKQKELNELYDEFTAKYGLLNSRANSLAFSEDSSYYLLCSLENIDENGELESKADMFTKRTIRPEVNITSVDTPSEALAISIGERGMVDLPYMAELLGTPNDFDTITSELHGIIFKDPMGPDDMDKGWHTADDYLSGNVRDKLRIARLAVQNDERYRINVEALEKAQPKDLDASEIDVRIGATWIDPRYIQQFMEETFETPFYLRRSIEVNYSPLTAEWQIKGKSAPGRHDVNAYVTYGTDRANAYRILEDSLNLKDIRIYDTIEEPDGKQKRVLNKKETTLAQQKQQAIKDAFADWIWKEPNRRQTLVEKYNEMFNSTRPREFDGSHIRFGGMNPDIKLREHQKNAIAHVLYGGNTLLAHEVGAGKTFEMAASAMEAKRLGLCQKSLFVVPNHLTLQWANEFLRLYPSAKLLVASKKDFETANRKKFCARIATGDYDAVIIGHSQFERIPISAERQEKLLREQIDDIENALNEMKYQRGENFSIKQMEKTRKSLQTRLDKLLATDRKDDVITFEQLGVDRLFVDESHGFKNLFLYTKMRNVAGLSTSEAQKSSDMFMKCRYMDELTGGKGVIFATGTPVSNSMTELYTVMRYLQYGTLQQKNLTHFDCWASTFGETATTIELAPEGTGYRARTRFAKFFNLPELMNMFKEVADIKTSDQLNLPVPEAKFETVVVQPSEIQKEMVASLSERAAVVHSGSVDPSVDNMLKITSDGRKIGLDQRLMNPLLPDDPSSKLNACVNNVFDIWDKGTDKKLTQLVFCDLSTPKKDSTFNVYDDIKAKLITRGVPENEIAFIHDADSEAKKKELFSKVRTGQVRVLLGSTQKMGAGTNVQDKLVAVHHLDVGWRPSDMTQRNGRIIRQGNQNKEIQVYQYVTEGTFDAYLYQTLENKQKFISQIMTSKSPVRSCDDVDEQALSYAEIKALCAGNPLIKEKMDLDIDVARLKVLKADHQSKVYRLEDQLLKYFPAEIEKYQSFIKGFEKDMEVVEQHPLPKEDFVGITVGTKHFTDKELAGEAILATCKNFKGTEPMNIGEYRGFKMELDYDSFNQEYQLTLKGNMSHRLTIGTDPRGNLIRMDNALAGIPNRLEKSKTQLDNLYNQQEAAKVEVKRTFPLESELSQKSARLAELDAALNMDEQSEAKPEKEERVSVLAELKRHSDGIPHERSKSDMEVAL